MPSKHASLLAFLILILVNGKSFAALSAEEKDSLSHRGNALRKLRDQLKEII